MVNNSQLEQTIREDLLCEMLLLFFFFFPFHKRFLSRMIASLWCNNINVSPLYIGESRLEPCSGQTSSISKCHHGTGIFRFGRILSMVEPPL